MNSWLDNPISTTPLRYVDNLLLDNCSVTTLVMVLEEPIGIRYLGHVTGYQPIRNQYFLLIGVSAAPDRNCRDPLGKFRTDLNALERIDDGGYYCNLFDDVVEIWTITAVSILKLTLRHKCNHTMAYFIVKNRARIKEKIKIRSDKEEDQG
eukprot:sb/3473447/